MNIEEKKLKLLSKTERYYFDVMNSGNCLYLRGKPGTAKSALGKSISKKISVKYLDRRLSQIDETDIGLYPVLDNAFSKLEKLGRLRELGYITEEEFNDLKAPLLKTIKDNQVDLLHFAVPEWAFNANCEPTIIHLEELNRANQHVRNAALQLLNERQIGDLVLNENVFIMSSGNLGDEDGTEVDEMELALSNRLVIVDHELPIEEWVQEYAQYHVWQIIIDYVRANPAEYYKLPNEKEIRYATPRSWTNLSKFILYKFGKEPHLKEEVIPFLLENGKSFIGNSITGFVRYCQEISNININDILIRWNEIKNDVAKFNRARISEIMSNLKYIDVTKLEDVQLNNLFGFLDSLKRNEDEITSYLVYLLDNTDENNFDTHSKFIQHFDKKMKSVRELASRNLKKI